MTKSVSMILVVLAMTLAACASPGTTSDDTTADLGQSSVSTTVAASSTTTVAPTTTSTSVAAPTTTTSGADSPGADALKAAFAASAEITSGRMEGSMEVTGLDPSQGVVDMVIPFGGAFDNVTGDSSFYMDMSSMAAAAEAAGEEIPPEFAGFFDGMEFRQVGDTAYVKFGFFNMFLGAETPWIAMPADESDSMDGFTMGTPGNPADILGSYEDAGATVEVIGSENVNGVDATHYRAVFDMETLLATATPEELEQLEDQGPLPIDALPMDVWVSDDGFVVRFVMEIDGQAVETAPGEEFGHMQMRYDMFDLNTAVSIEPPPSDQVTHIDDLDAGFGFDLDA